MNKDGWATIGWFGRISGLALILVVSVGLVMAQSSQLRVPVGHIPAEVRQLRPIGSLPPTNRLKLSISLPIRHREALTNLLEQLYNPASPLYHHYLSAKDFDARFSPTEQEYQAVIDFATNSGFTITARHPNRMLLEVSATVSDVERALRVMMRVYAHPTESRTFFAPDTDPTVGSNLPILNIGGLDDFARPHPQHLRHSPLKSS